MSYDLAVFDPTVAPRDRGEFEDWYGQVSEWEEEPEYTAISKCPPALQAWYRDMLKTFGALNGPDAVQLDDHDAESGSMVSDYCVARHLVYVGFAWSKADLAYETAMALAAKHGVGFLDASGDTGAAYFPDGKGGLELVHEANDEE
jgi:hypothetical protein